MGLPVLKILSGVDALDARLLVTMYEAALKAVPMSAIVKNAIQISSQGNSLKFAHIAVLATTGFVVGGSKFMYSKVAEYLTGRGSQRNDPPPNRNESAALDQQIQERRQEVVVPLILLIAHFHEKFQNEQILLEHADKSMDQKLKEMESILDKLTEEDIDTAVQNLQIRLDGIIKKHQENIPSFNAALGELEEAGQDLAQAEENLAKAQEEYKKIVSEITAHKTLLARSRTENLQVFLEKVDALLDKGVL